MLQLNFARFFSLTNGNLFNLMSLDWTLVRFDFIYFFFSWSQFTSIVSKQFHSFVYLKLCWFLHSVEKKTFFFVLNVCCFRCWLIVITQKLLSNDIFSVNNTYANGLTDVLSVRKTKIFTKKKIMNSTDKIPIQQQILWKFFQTKNMCLYKTLIFF